MQDRTLLVVAGEFPPLKTIGRIRTVKFVQHLRSHGWRSVVLTVEPSGREPNFDPSLYGEIPEGTEVVRVPMPDIEERIARAAKRLLRRGAVGEVARTATQSATGSSLSTDVAPATNPGAGGLMDLAHAMTRHVLRNYVEIPDSYRFWARNATEAARRIVRERNIDVVYTTLPPFSAAWVGHAIRHEFGIPWVVDYRDLWYGDVLREWVPKWRQRLELRTEKRLLRLADAIVTVSEPKTEYMRKMHPGLGAHWETLTNGYDSDIYAGRSRTRPFDDNIEFVFTGRLFKNRKGYAFAEALGRIAQTDRALANRVRVRILGDVSPEIRRRYDEILKAYSIEALFLFEGDVSYQAAMSAQVNCDYLLLIVDQGETSDGVIPGKLFEYVAAHRPIFALCDRGITRDIIERAYAGVVVPADDAKACEDELRNALRQHPVLQPARNAKYLEQFERGRIAERFGELLTDLACKQSVYKHEKSVSTSTAIP